MSAVRNKTIWNNASVDNHLSTNIPNIFRLDHYVSVHTRSNWQCSVCSHIWATSWQNIKRPKHGTRCPKCVSKAQGLSQRLTQPEVLHRLHKNNPTITIHSEYINSKTKVKFKCSNNHCWNSLPHTVIMGNSGCPKCANNQKYTNTYVDQHLVGSNIVRLNDIVNSQTNINWQCVSCSHVWNTKPTKIVSCNTSCPKCMNKLMLTEDIISRRLIDSNIPIRLVGEYLGYAHKTTWNCKVCDHNWLSKPGNILTQHTGCPNCSPTSYSKKSIIWLTQSSIDDNIHIQHAENGGEFIIPTTKMKVDGYCESTNTVFEFYGDIWHGNPRLYKPHEICCPLMKDKTADNLYNRTKYKEEKIKKLGYNLITIWESDYDKQQT